jgi:hypothetical protein
MTSLRDLLKTSEIADYFDEIARMRVPAAPCHCKVAQEAAGWRGTVPRRHADEFEFRCAGSGSAQSRGVRSEVGQAPAAGHWDTATDRRMTRACELR